MLRFSRIFPDVERARRIFRLGVPIMGGMSTYTILELLDLLFIGYLGIAALVAVGISVFITFSYLALFGGVSIAVQATTSRLVGEETTRPRSIPAHGARLLCRLRRSPPHCGMDRTTSVDWRHQLRTSVCTSSYGLGRVLRTALDHLQI
jgi:hypothetical protein